MEAIKEGGSRQFLAADLPDLLQKIPPTGALTQDAQHAQANPPRVVERSVVIDAPNETLEQLQSRR
jgi:hypothetical protein